MHKTVVNVIESICGTSFELGKLAMLEQLPSIYMEQAQKYFALGRDDLANLFRDEAKKATTHAEKERSKYESRYRPLGEEGWRILDKIIPSDIKT